MKQRDKSAFLIPLIFLCMNLPVHAKPQEQAQYQELISQAEQQGEVNVIVSLAEDKPMGESMRVLQNGSQAGETQPHLVQQEAFMNKLGGKGVLEYQYFNETPSISLKLNADGLRSLLSIKHGVSNITALGDVLL